MKDALGRTRRRLLATRRVASTSGAAGVHVTRWPSAPCSEATEPVPAPIFFPSPLLTPWELSDLGGLSYLRSGHVSALTVPSASQYRAEVNRAR